MCLTPRIQRSTSRRWWGLPTRYERPFGGRSSAPVEYEQNVVWANSSEVSDERLIAVELIDL